MITGTIKSNFSIIMIKSFVKVNISYCLYNNVTDNTLILALYFSLTLKIFFHVINCEQVIRVQKLWILLGGARAEGRAAE